MPIADHSVQRRNRLSPQDLPPPPSDDRIITWDFSFLTLSHFLQALGYSSMLLFPLYLDSLGASRAEIGTIMASAATAGLCFRPVVGWALDTFGRRPVLMVGTFLIAIGMGLVYFVDDLGWFVYLERVIFGLGVGACFTGYFTFAADLVPASRRTEGLALFGVAGLVPLFVNPLSSKLGVAPADLRWFLPCVGLIILSSILTLLLVSEPPRQTRRQPLTLTAVWSSIRASSLWSVWVATVVFSGSVALFMSFATVTASKRGIATPTALWLSYAGGAVAVRVLGAKLPDKIGPANLVVPALGSYMAAMLVVAGAWSQTGFLIAGLLGGFGHGYCFPVLSGQVVTRVPEVHRGSGLAAYTALWGVSEIALAPAFGLFADHNGDAAMFSLAAVLSFFGLVAWAFLEHRYSPGPSG